MKIEVSSLSPNLKRKPNSKPNQHLVNITLILNTYRPFLIIISIICFILSPIALTIFITNASAWPQPSIPFFPFFGFLAGVFAMFGFACLCSACNKNSFFGHSTATVNNNGQSIMTNQELALQTMNAHHQQYMSQALASAHHHHHHHSHC